MGCAGLPLPLRALGPGEQAGEDHLRAGVDAFERRVGDLHQLAVFGAVRHGRRSTGSSARSRSASCGSAVSGTPGFGPEGAAPGRSGRTSGCSISAQALPAAPADRQPGGRFGAAGAGHRRARDRPGRGAGDERQHLEAGCGRARLTSWSAAVEFVDAGRRLDARPSRSGCGRCRRRRPSGAGTVRRSAPTAARRPRRWPGRRPGRPRRRPVAAGPRPRWPARAHAPSPASASSLRGIGQLGLGRDRGAAAAVAVGPLPVEHDADRDRRQHRDRDQDRDQRRGAAAAGLRAGAGWPWRGRDRLLLRRRPCSAATLIGYPVPRCRRRGLLPPCPVVARMTPCFFFRSFFEFRFAGAFAGRGVSGRSSSFRSDALPVFCGWGLLFVLRLGADSFFAISLSYTVSA